jgi:hypothetical protein
MLFFHKEDVFFSQRSIFFHPVLADLSCEELATLVTGTSVVSSLKSEDGFLYSGEGRSSQL